ncbi:hypothetical protein X798_04399 [Onchocerca flexuosa]|uniref:Uncharacterized protein n=1 Tax=Onchocerca flexuosa TaxID=387005 RepID=A0A238BUL6_9BILA|nr:hypothetical protein X798_04399 [Onchocerca flexuosa]
MKSDITIIITVGVCATVATGLLLYYFYKKKERNRKKTSLEKQTESAGRLPPKKRGRLQMSRPVIPPKHISRMKKLSTSSETFGDSSTKSNISKISKKIKSYSPSHVDALETSSSISSSEKSKTLYSSESYPPAVIRQQKELPKIVMSSEKSEKSRENKILVSDAGRLSPVKLPKAEKLDKIKSVESIDVIKLLATEETPSSTEVIPIKLVESIDVTKLLATEETPSSTEVIPVKSHFLDLQDEWIDSYCYCGQDMAISSHASEELNEKCKVELLPTIVKPVSFDPYSPEDLTQVEGSSDEMSKNSMQINPIPKNHHIIVPFLPILHAITYASKHAQLLQELLQNYEYFESQSLESS